MASTWAKEPQDVVVAVIRPSTAQGSSEQEKGKYPPEKDMPKWSVKWGTSTDPWQNFFCAEADAPAVGDTIKVRKFFVLEGTEEKYPKWMLESDYQKTLGGKKGFGGGGFAAAKPNLSPEQEMMDKAIGHAMNSIKNGMVAGEADTPIPATFKNIDKAADYWYKKIRDAGKTSPQA